MIILTMRTDKPEAELGIYEGENELAHENWQAHRQLSETLLSKIDEILNKSSKSKDELGGVVIYKGPGSFTGLRIGFSVANALAYAHDIPVVAAAGENWTADGIKKIAQGDND